MRISFSSIFQAFTGRGGATATAEAPVGQAKPTMGTDELKTSPVLRNARFGNSEELAAVLAGKATFAPGAKGDGVQAVQQALQDMAFVLPSGVDGAFGRQTTQALKNFQSFVGLPQSGTLDAATLKALDRYAPAPGKTSWDPGQDPGPIPSPDLGHGKKARVVVDISQHRLFMFDKNGDLTKIYGVRSGNAAVGNGTKAGVKIIENKLADPTSVAKALWGGTGTAFGTRLLNLSDYDVATGKTYYGKHKGQELHGTYQNESIGQDFSHGCVGLKNSDIEEIFDQLKAGELVRFVD